MKILVLGATGYVGSHVARAFRRAGHEVWGLTRGTGEAAGLASDELHPLIGDLARPDSYRPTAEACDVLVQAAQDYQHDTAALDRLTVETLLGVASSGGRQKTLVYTGGCWDYGNTGGRVVDETSAVNPLPAIGWRPGVEELVLGARGARTVVLRLGNVYGYGGKLTNPWFEGATLTPPLRVVGTGDEHWPMVHVDDLAEAYVRAAESGVSGEVLNLTDGAHPTVRELAETIARAAGYKGRIEYVPVARAKSALGAMAEAFAQDALVDSSKAEKMLGWRPHRLGFLAEAATYLAAWRAREGIALSAVAPRQAA